MSKEIETLSKLKDQLVTFLDELIEQFPGEPDFVIFRIFLKDRIPIVDVMNYIILQLLPLKQMIKDRDENFFLNNNVLFEKFDQEKSSKVNHFRKLWLSKNVDNEDRQAIWRWFDAFVRLAEIYSSLKK